MVDSTANRAPTILAINFCILKRWLGLDSKNMVVEMCKKLPPTTAIRARSPSWDSPQWKLLIHSPNGEATAKGIT